jgi:outer membrane lipoprotein-sorting protein
MKKVLCVLAAALLVLSGCGQAESPAVSSAESASAVFQQEEAASATSQQEEPIGAAAEYDTYRVELQDAEFFTQDDQPMVRVYMEYTNNGPDGLYLMESFSIKAFQNDVQIEDRTDINDDALSAPVIQEVKNGESIVGSYVFALSDSSDVEVRVCTPTADEDLLACKIYPAQ